MGVPCRSGRPQEGAFVRKLFGICSALVIVFCAASAPLVSSPEKVCLAPPAPPTESYGPPAPVSSVLLVGIATWYDASRNNAWYTRKSAWGSSVKFYAAAGPSFRALLSRLAGQKLRMGVGYWRTLAKAGTRPEFILTSPRTGMSITVVITDTCTCTRMIDLSPAAFVALGLPIGVGINKVEVRLP